MHKGDFYEKRKIKAITSFTLIGSILFGGNINSTQAESDLKKIVPDQMVPAFLDVPSNHWANVAINNLLKKEIIVGYGNNKFGLGDSVTREQVAAVIYRIKFPEKEVEAEAQNPYRDVNKSSTMFLDEILTLTKMGIFSGDEKGNFRPKSPISRAEMTQVIKNAFNIPVVGKHNFRDVAKDYWANDAISALQSNQLVSGTGNGLFEPYKSVTREEYAQFIFNVLNFEDLVNKEKQLDELNKRRDVINQKIDEFDKLNSQRKDLERMLEELNQKLSQLKQQSPQLQDLKNKLKESQSRLLELNKKDSNRLELNSEIKKLNDRKAELLSLIMELIKQQSEFDKKIKNEKDDLNKKREDLINRIAESKELAKKKAELNTKLVELFKVQEALNKKSGQYLYYINKLDNELRELADKYKNSDNKISRLKNHIGEYNKQLEKIENELEECNKKIDNTKKQLAEFDKSNKKQQELESELVQLNKKIDELGKRHKHRQELEASQKKLSMKLKK